MDIAEARSWAADDLPGKKDLPGEKVPMPAPGHTVPRSGYVFVSYNRESDRSYVEQLVAYLRKAGISTWVDTSDIEYGGQWAEQLEEAIAEASAVAVVMTPAAESSRWVKREINFAEDRNQRILPLLLEGNRFFLLSDLQHEDVTGGKMPSDRWIEQLRSHLTGQSD